MCEPLLKALSKPFPAGEIETVSETRVPGACGYKKGLLFTLRLAHARDVNSFYDFVFTPL
jgi:hypothetical protein